jgi:hypothetical protein
MTVFALRLGEELLSKGVPAFGRLWRLRRLFATVAESAFQLEAGSSGRFPKQS